MNKPIIAAIAAMAVLTSTAMLTSSVYAQLYGGSSGSSIGTATPEQLERCDQLGIPRETCNDVNILAKERLTAAQENPSTGSGTPMLSTTSGQLVVFIGVLGAIFGGVAAAFFFRGRGAKPVKT